MSLYKKLESTVFKIIPGPVMGLLAIIVCLLGYFIAYLLYPPWEYTIFHFGSALGVGPGGVFFNYGLVISGFLFLLFYIYLNEVFKRENVNEKLRKISFFFAMASTVFFILNGLFPGYIDDLFFYWAHGTFALFCYLTAIVYIAIYSYIFLKNQKFSKIHAYMGFVIAGMISVFIFVWISPLQWGFTLPFFVWIFYVPINLLYRKM